MYAKTIAMAVFTVLFAMLIIVVIQTTFNYANEAASCITNPTSNCSNK